MSAWMSSGSIGPGWRRLFATARSTSRRLPASPSPAGALRRMADGPLRDPLDADRLIARAIESVLDAVPEIPGGDMISADTSPKSQPWAETAAPPASDKRPLETVVAEFEARVASSPGARAGHPNEPHPGTAYLEKLSPGARS